MQNSLKILGFCLLVLAFSVCDIHAQDVKTVTISAMRNSMAHQMAEDVVRKAYQRIGIHAQFDYVPPQRALETANTGVTDGDVGRIAGTEKIFNHLIPIPVPVVYIHAYAFTKRINRPIRSWEDLRGLKTGIIRGIRYSELGTSGMKTYPARSYRHLFQLLESGRIDVAIAVKEAGEKEIHLHYRSTGIHIIGETLYSAPLFHYIHKKNRNMAFRLEKALKDMEQQGLIEEIWEKARLKILTTPEDPDL